MDYLISIIIICFFIMLILLIVITNQLSKIINGEKEIILELNRVNSAIKEVNKNK